MYSGEDTTNGRTLKLELQFRTEGDVKVKDAAGADVVGDGGQALTMKRGAVPSERDCSDGVSKRKTTLPFSFDWRRRRRIVILSESSKQITTEYRMFSRNEPSNQLHPPCCCSSSCSSPYSHCAPGGPVGPAFRPLSSNGPVAPCLTPLTFLSNN